MNGETSEMYMRRSTRTSCGPGYVNIHQVIPACLPASMVEFSLMSPWIVGKPIGTRFLHLFATKYGGVLYTFPLSNVWTNKVSCSEALCNRLGAFHPHVVPNYMYIH